MSGEGLKYDGEKVRLDLLSTRWLMGVGRVLTYGARKYASWNWAKGIESSRLIGAGLRHLLAYAGGEDLDPETGLCHLWHCSCCLMFLSHLRETRPELDDRWKDVPKARDDVSTKPSPPVSIDPAEHVLPLSSADVAAWEPRHSTVLSGALCGAGAEESYWEALAAPKIQPRSGGKV